MLTEHRDEPRFPIGVYMENLIYLYISQRMLKIPTGRSSDATPPDEFSHFRVFFGRHSKLLKFANFTLRLARARARLLKINEINVPVARVWGTSAKPKGPGLEKYARQNQECL